MDSRGDVVVVGGGLAGLAAANRAAELGQEVVVLEQGTDERYLCNSRITGGVFHICFRGAMDEPAELAKTILQATGGFAKPSLAEAIATDGSRVIRWLQSLGVRFMRAGPEDWKSFVLAPPGWSLDWRGRGGDVMLRTLADRLAGRGGRLVRGARARSLTIEGGRCVGVEAESDGQMIAFPARAVVLADGGFQTDAELMRAHVTAHPEALRQRNAGTGRGDGLRMAAAAGASVVGAETIYGHILCREAMGNDRLSPFPFLDTIATAGIVVDSGGSRFADEGRGGVYLTNAIARLPDPLSAWVIFDDVIWRGPATEFVFPPNPSLVSAGATIHHDASIGALAAKAGLPGDALAATVAAYNRAVTGGEEAALSPPRNRTAHKPYPIATPPFLAIAACAGVTYTMGGIEIDANGSVLRPDGAAIAGLYAAGSTTGGLEGGADAGYVSGLVKAAVFGMRAAEHIARTKVP